MAYTYFDGSLPDETTQNGSQFGQSTRMNFNALADMLLTGDPIRYNVSNTVDANGRITQSIFTNNVNTNDKIRVDYTYDANDFVTISAYYRSTDGGTTWDPIGKHTFSYDANYNVTGQTWSDVI